MNKAARAFCGPTVGAVETKREAMKDIRRLEMDLSGGRPAHESRRSPGHEARMAAHARRIRSSLCECVGDQDDHQEPSPDVCYTLPAWLIPDVKERWQAEDQIRVHAFNCFYRALHAEHDLAVRFVRALVASAGPIKDHGLVTHWHQRHGARQTPKAEEATT